MLLTISLVWLTTLLKKRKKGEKMKICPKCKIYYADYVNQCGVCFTNLIKSNVVKKDVKNYPKDQSTV